MRILIPPRPITKNIYDLYNEQHGHTHWEVVIFDKGVTQHYIQGKYIPCKIGDVYFIGPPHHHHIQSDRYPRNHYDIYFTENEFKEICDEFDSDLYSVINSNYIHLKLEPIVAQNLIQQLQTIEINLQLNKNNFNLFKQVSISILRFLLGYYSINKLNKKESHPQWIYDLLIELQDPSNLSFPPNYFFSKYHYSRSRFAQLFKKHTGTTFSNYLKIKRIEYAAELLMKTNKTILEICTQVGYDSYPFFLKTFKEHYSVSPKEYRKNLFS